MNAERLHRLLPIFAAILVTATMSFACRAIEPTPLSTHAAERPLVRASVTHPSVHPVAYTHPAAPHDSTPIHGAYIIVDPS